MGFFEIDTIHARLFKIPKHIKAMYHKEFFKDSSRVSRTTQSLSAILPSVWNYYSERILRFSVVSKYKPVYEYE